MLSNLYGRISRVVKGKYCTSAAGTSVMCYLDNGLHYVSDNVFIICIGPCATMDSIVFLTFPEAGCDNSLVLCDIRYGNRK